MVLVIGVDYRGTDEVALVFDPNPTYDPTHDPNKRVVLYDDLESARGYAPGAWSFTWTNL